MFPSVTFGHTLVISEHRYDADWALAFIARHAVGRTKYEGRAFWSDNAIRYALLRVRVSFKSYIQYRTHSAETLAQTPLCCGTSMSRTSVLDWNKGMQGMIKCGFAGVVRRFTPSRDVFSAIAARVLFPIAIFSLAAASHAQDSASVSADEAGTKSTGSTFDFWTYREPFWRNTPGNGTRDLSSFEHHQLLFGGNWQLRARVRATDGDTDFIGDDNRQIESYGLGEVDVRLLTMPYRSIAKRRAIAVGVETFLPSGDASGGSDTLSFGPQVSGVFFTPFGLKGTLFAPSYQHIFSVYEKSGAQRRHAGGIDLLGLWQSPDKKKWVLANPQLLLDYHAGTEYINVDVEAGMFLDRTLGTKGHSAYLRPGFQMGRYRNGDASIRFGYRINW